MSVIQTENLSKVYRTTKIPVTALETISLTVMRGEFTALVGPSGSGKTTLLNLIGGLDEPTTGRVMVNGVDISQLQGNALIDFRLHHIGFVFQAFNLIPVLTAQENVEFIMLLQKRPAAERRLRALELLEAVGIGDKARHRPAELSGGQQQRVAVARALASRPQFILADEPTANLDSKSAETLLNLMADLNQKDGITFIFSTHDSRVVERARRIITLQDGHVLTDLART